MRLLAETPGMSANKLMIDETYSGWACRPPRAPTIPVEWYIVPRITAA